MVIVPDPVIDVVIAYVGIVAAVILASATQPVADGKETFHQ